MRFVCFLLVVSFQIGVEAGAFHALETVACCLAGAEACVGCFVGRLYLPALDEAFEFLHAVAANVVVNIVISLAAETLQQEVAVVSHFEAETVAAETAVRPSVAVIL